MRTRTPPGNTGKITPEQALQRTIQQVLDGLMVSGADLTFPVVAAHVLHELAASGRITWPISGRDLSKIVAHCVGEAGLGVCRLTPEVMRQLVRSGVLMNMALSDWYRPGPKFNGGRGHNERP